MYTLTGLKLKNPTILAAGVLGTTGASLAQPRQDGHECLDCAVGLCGGRTAQRDALEGRREEEGEIDARGTTGCQRLNQKRRPCLAAVVLSIV